MESEWFGILNCRNIEVVVSYCNGVDRACCNVKYEVKRECKKFKDVKIGIRYMSFAFECDTNLAASFT
jgi:hypothetical protein